MNRDDLLIWWTSSAECDELGEPVDVDDVKDGSTREELVAQGFFVKDANTPWPEYLWVEYDNRYGNAGRGRLWIPQEMGIKRIEWDDSKPVAKLLANRGGIVFYATDAELLVGLPGIITTLELDVINPKGVVHLQ